MKLFKKNSTGTVNACSAVASIEAIEAAASVVFHSSKNCFGKNCLSEIISVNSKNDEHK